MRQPVGLYCGKERNERKCVETIIVFIATAIIVWVKKDMFFETRHVGRILDEYPAEALTR